MLTVDRIEGIPPHCETNLLNSDCPYIALGCKECEIPASRRSFIPPIVKGIEVGEWFEPEQTVNNTLIQAMTEAEDALRRFGIEAEKIKRYCEKEEVEKMTWQPIETAPKDGEEEIMLHTRIGVVSAWFCDSGEWVCYDDLFSLQDNEPTHWMPIPDLP